jgi:hypothetical protein
MGDHRHHLPSVKPSNLIQRSPRSVIDINDALAA